MVNHVFLTNCSNADRFKDFFAGRAFVCKRFDDIFGKTAIKPHEKRSNVKPRVKRTRVKATWNKFLYLRQMIANCEGFMIIVETQLNM